MPNTRHGRNHRQREEDDHNNNHQAPVAPVAPQPREVAAVGGHAMGHRQNANRGGRLQKCCSPGSCRSPDETIDTTDPYDAVKVLCNNEACTEGSWMHKDCFDEFQQSVLAYLRSCGRARSWSEKQRLQNLWTKKGYDLAFKACDCKCGRGHIRKDLDYIPPPVNDNAKKHKKHKKKNDKPMPVVSTTHKTNSHNNHTGHLNGNGNPVSTNGTAPVVNSITSTGTNNHGHQNHANHTGRGPNGGGKKSANGTRKSEAQSKHDDNGNGQLQPQHHLDNQTSVTTTTTVSTTTTTVVAPDSPHIMPGNSNLYFLHGLGNPQLRLRTNSVSSTGSVGSHSSSISSIPSSAGSASPISSSPVSGDMFFKGRKSSSDASSDYGPISATGFRQRLDLSAFACLPRNKQNPYHIRMEDATTLAYSFASSCSLGAAKGMGQWGDGGAEAGGCDVETRNFVLSNLLNKRMCSTRCALCKTHLPVFDRFPLLDGTFFLSPQSYDESAIQVIWDGRLQFLNAVCLGCLEGGSGEVKCVACKRPWDGRSLVLGSMYTYDVFAAAPCCQKRLTCKCCRRAVVNINTGLDFYSQYSHMIICPYCKANDYHFIRSLPDTFILPDTVSVGPPSAPICH